MGRYSREPIKFCRDLLHAEPDPWQAEALEAIAQGHNVAVRSGHGVGKTAMLAWTTLWFLTTRPYPKIPCTAPTQHQLSDLLWAEIATWMARSSLRSILTWTATKLALTGAEEAWFAVARASTRPENLAGFHAGHLLYIVDEGSGVSDSIFQAVDGALTTEGAQIVMAGNPTQLAGYFHRAFHEGRSQWYNIAISSLDSPRVDASYGPGMAAKWGADSDIFRVRVLGEFPLAETTSFIRLDVVESAIKRFEAAEGEAEGTCELGVDVARFGDDETVFVVRRGYRVTHIERRHGWDTMQTAGRSVQIAKEFECATVSVDDTGVGGGVTDALRQNLPDAVRLNPCNFGGEGDEHYHNATGVMWGFLKDGLRGGLREFPNEADLIGQLTTRRFSLTPKGKIVLERKEDMKKRGLPSPDIADAVALAFAGSSLAAAPAAGVSIEGNKNWDGAN